MAENWLIFPMKSIKIILYIIGGAGVLLIFGFFAFLLAAGPTTGKYKADIEACIAARANGTAKSITAYICPEGKVANNFDVGYQVVLDQEFKKLDKEVISQLRDYQGQRTRQPIDVNKKLVNWFDETWPNAKDGFPMKYTDICSNLSTEWNPLREVVLSFSGGVSTDGNAGQFLFGASSCEALVKQKMSAYRTMGELIGTRNTVQSYTDDKDIFVDTLNENYQNFLMQWTIYIGELARIKSKWNIKTRTQNG